MANLVITSTDESVTITTGVYSAILGFSTLTVDKDYLYAGIADASLGDYIEIFQYPGDQKHPVTWDNTSITYPIVDSVNGVAPTSQAHLHSMLIALNSFRASNYDSTALEASAVIKSSTATLLSIDGHNSGPQQYLQFFNTTSVPADGATPVFVMILKANDNFFWKVSEFGKKFSTGICISNSSTLATKTIGAADCWFSATYKTP